jgi:hypothetical protein
MLDILGALRAVLTDSTAHGYLLFGVCVFVTVLMFLYLVSLASSEKQNVQASVAKRRNDRYFAKEH